MLTLQDLVDNDSVSPAGADVLRDIGGRVESFLVYSLPRNAGKTTTAQAVVAAAPPGTPHHEFLGTQDEVTKLTSQPASGYLVVAEMGHRGRPGYLAEEEIVRAFEVVRHGYALASSLHADTVAQVFEVLAGNGVAPETAIAARHLIKVQPLGDPFDPATRRVVEQIHEITGIDDQGAPAVRVLYRSDAA